MLRRLLLVLPALAVGIVLWAVLTTGWPAPVSIARVVGGPTLGTNTLSWLLSVQRLEDERRVPSPGLGVRVSVENGTDRAAWAGTTDGAGEVEAVLRLARPLTAAAHVRVESSDGQLLADGEVELDRDTWHKGARRQLAGVPGRQRGNLWLGVFVREGTLAVPFSSELSIRVTGGATDSEAREGMVSGYHGIAGVTVEVELTGAERTDPTAPLRTDEKGTVSLGLRPLEHAITLQLHVQAAAGVDLAAAYRDKEPAAFLYELPADGSPATGEWFGSLPVTPGALHVTRNGTQLLVRSPIPRERAYLSLVDGQHRLAGYILALTQDADGGASASVQLDSELRPPSGELYAVVSSEPDKRSPGTVGWQLGPPGLAHTFDVPEQLLLDGSAGVLQLERAARLARRQVAAILLSLVGAAMVAAFALEARSSARRAAAAPAELALGSQRGWLALALGCLLLGIGALAYFGLAQR
jgi:hypothetical protein